jgi:uncharacterized protein DUF5318
MTTLGRSFDPTRPPSPPSSPSVDYSLARRAALSAVRKGLIGTTDVCDAHPELLRAAKNIGDSVAAPCPICSHDTLKWVRYVYGDELRSNNGRVVYPAEWLDELTAAHDQFTCYVVEVCVDCAWNHLVRSYLTGRRFVTGGGRQQGGRRKQRG